MHCCRLTTSGQEFQLLLWWRLMASNQALGNVSLCYRIKLGVWWQAWIHLSPKRRNVRFSLLWLEITPSGPSKVKFCVPILKVRCRFPIMFHSNHVSISRRQDDIHDFHFVTLKSPLQGYPTLNFLRILKSDIDFPIVFRTSYMLVSHHQ